MHMQLTGDGADDLAMGRFEPCSAFEGDGTGTAVCGACGWLDDEHDPTVGIATVRMLAPPPPARPARLAS